MQLMQDLFLVPYWDTMGIDTTIMLHTLITGLMA